MARVKTQISRATLRILQAAGVFRRVANSPWRRKRLLILCYHGVSLEDEHLWRPSLYIEPARLQRRLEMLKKGGYNVLPLGEALQELKTGTLPPRSVVLTFDDGGYDFYARAYPIVKTSGFPATVYQTTYYVDRPLPLFNLICSYMLWKRRGSTVEGGRELGLADVLDLRTEPGREKIAQTLQESAEKQTFSGAQKNELASRLAGLLGIDYRELEARRVLHLMNASEISQLAREGVDFQLHTHRHRAPLDEARFRQEIGQNRSRLCEIAGYLPKHFCYPGGNHDEHFLPWLADEKIISATTCDPALATARTNPWLLPRFVDTTGRTEVEFESWLTGVGNLASPARP